MLACRAGVVLFPGIVPTLVRALEYEDAQATIRRVTPDRHDQMLVFIIGHSGIWFSSYYSRYFIAIATLTLSLHVRLTTEGRGPRSEVAQAQVRGWARSQVAHACSPRRSRWPRSQVEEPGGPGVAQGWSLGVGNGFRAFSPNLSLRNLEIALARSCRQERIWTSCRTAIRQASPPDGYRVTTVATSARARHSQHRNPCTADANGRALPGGQLRRLAHRTAIPGK